MIDPLDSKEKMSMILAQKQQQLDTGPNTSLRQSIDAKYSTEDNSVLRPPMSAPTQSLAMQTY